MMPALLVRRAHLRFWVQETIRRVVVQLRSLQQRSVVQPFDAEEIAGSGRSNSQRLSIFAGAQVALSSPSRGPRPAAHGPLAQHGATRFRWRHVWTSWRLSTPPLPMRTSCTWGLRTRIRVHLDGALRSPASNLKSQRLTASQRRWNALAMKTLGRARWDAAFLLQGPLRRAESTRRAKAICSWTLD